MTAVPSPRAAVSSTVAATDRAVSLDAAQRGVLAAVADRLIPDAHGMPSARDVITEDRLRFVLGVRPDLAAPVRAALRPELGDDPEARLATLERDEPAHHAALLLAVVGGYYTDADVRARLGYPGQQALSLESWEAPYIAEGLVDRVRARGPVWRDPATGRRAERG